MSKFNKSATMTEDEFNKVKVMQSKLVVMSEEERIKFFESDSELTNLINLFMRMTPSKPRVSQEAKGLMDKEEQLKLL